MTKDFIKTTILFLQCSGSGGPKGIHAPVIKAMLMNNAFHEVGVYCRGVYIHA